MIHIICTDISGIDEETYKVLYERASLRRRSRADQYRDREDALRCLTAEALLRYALGTCHYTEETWPDGKPYILEQQDFHYNVSHSGRWVVLAWGDRELGVDVEQIRPDSDVAAIGRRFFTEDEQRYILEDPAVSRSRFFEIWTGKESYVKFLGTGMKKAFRSFSVRNLPQDVMRYHRKLDADYSLSLCAAKDDITLRILDLQQLL